MTSRDTQRITPEGLAEGLRSRHITMIALGGAIGVGLFLGSGAAVAEAGPSIILSYAVVGVFSFLVMRALGELLMYRPVSGSFAEYAREFLGPIYGFITGWGYWLTWSLIGMTEISAAGVYVNFWFPAVPYWLTALVALALLVFLNLLRVGFFGEAEFWFASIKVIAILGFIALGLIVILFNLGPAGDSSFANLFAVGGGFMPFGISGFLLAIPIAVFSYQGFELVGMTASEARDRERVIPRAINRVPLRIGLFYIGSMVILMSIVDWTQLGGKNSPFVQALIEIGIPAAAEMMNFVVLTAALSSCNSGLYSNSRLLKRLSADGFGPLFLNRTGRSHVPAAAVMLSGGVMLFGVLLNAVIPEQAFSSLLTISTLAALWTSTVILICHMVYRRKVAAGLRPASPFPLPGGKYLVPLGLGFVAFVVVLTAFSEAGRIAFISLPIWAALLIGGYLLSKRFNPRHPRPDSEIDRPRGLAPSEPAPSTRVE